ncbi:ABC transporter ATP-binding protein [Streptococcus ovuberis]|uniref:ABC transporter ATP-binding protein n=1 Tax=Streptococcus ovuberis TaxID=1936207 RepID=A0A7X6N0L1_9STRE|nr:ABC transporter ATP-binding protein [Streptococcus ovuberis]NKZ20773.1 ABC transporter ATP-binding protein [Streptococcus ovuberis]
MSRIQSENLTVAYAEQHILSDLTLAIEDGKITTIIGANGCGKSTLLKALTRIIPARAGHVYLDGQIIAEMPTQLVAQKMALLPQVLEATAGISVYELVSYGRFPHQSGLGRLTDVDRERIDWALEATGTKSYSQLHVDSLSGGQRQRVWIAMALAQDTDIIFLDEPTTYLDMNHQLEVLDLLKHLNQTMGKTIVMVLHDLNLAARYSDRLIAMKDGKIKLHGQVAEVMTKEILKDLFKVEVEIVQDPIHHCPILLTYRLDKS